MKSAASVLLACTLCGCATGLTFEPNEMGAQQECAQRSANLAQYDDCMAEVETFYREYQEHRKLTRKDDS